MRAAIIALVTLSAFVAEAQTDPEKAQAAFEAAKEAYEKGEFERSIAMLREAYRYYPDPAIKVTIARRFIDLDEPTKALDELRGIEAKRWKLKRLVRQEIERVEDLLAQPVPVVIETDPPGAMVKIGDAAAARAPIRQSMERGQVQVAAIRPGYKPLSQAVRVKGTRAMTVTLKLEKILAYLRIELVGADPEREEGVPWIKLDDEMVGPGQRLEVDPGPHMITCGYEKGAPPTSLKVTVPEGKDATVRCALPGPLYVPVAWKKPVGWSSVGGGAAAIAAGVGLLVSYYAVDVPTYGDDPRYNLDGSSKPVAGGVAAGLGAGLVGLGTWFLLTDD